MKGYIVNSKCYVFPQEVGQIPEVEAEVIYVQEENFAAWLAANESVADKLKKYNYNVMTVNPKEWAGHTNDDLEPEPPTPTTYTLTLNLLEGAVLAVFDGTQGEAVDPTAVPANDLIEIYLNDGYTFNKEAQSGTIVEAALNGVVIEPIEGTVNFRMPSENSTLAITLTTPQL